MAHGRRWLIGAALVVALAVALVLIAAGGQPSLAEDGIIYVDADAGPAGDGTSWESAFTDLQPAIDAAIAGNEIWVAAGTYKPTSGDDRTISFSMKNELAIYGGFAGTETVRGLRDWVANPTILSGDLNEDDEDDFANNDENSYHVFYHPNGSDLDATAILDGFTITGGNADSTSWPNYKGGGMLNSYSSPTLANCTFAGNSALYWGGGMRNEDSSPELTNCTFADNASGEDGGGMFNVDSSPTLTHCTFIGNSAKYVGGGMYNSYSFPTLTHCTFDGNSADGGGGMYSYSSGPTLTDCTFTGNSADVGGGMANSGTGDLPTVSGCTFENNSASLGGGMSNQTSAPTVTNCTFTGNTADHGGGMYNTNARPVLANCTFTDNSATLGGGIYNTGNESTLTNCILWGDTAGELPYEIYGEAVTVTYSVVQGDLYPGTGNINDDPLFVDAANGDLRLQLTSPAIDAGDNEAAGLAGITTDLDGHPRFVGVVDRGAYEAPPDIIYVDQDATGASDGTTWDDALISCQDALTWAVDGVDVWAAAGTYKPTSGADRNASFQMVNGVGVYGGFDPSAGDTAWEDRDWLGNVTILSGDIGTQGDNADNSYHVFYHPDGTNLDTSAVLDGFTITGGSADGTEPHNRGGGMYNDASSPTLANLTFADNSASGSGGGMHNTSASSPALTNCTFQGNTAGDEGGGMHNDGSSPTLTGCTFSENTADAGGGIYNGNSSPELMNGTFVGNEANSGGGMHNDGSSPVLVNCTFTGNSAAGHGGGMRNKGSSAPALTNCTFQGNRAPTGHGGAIQNYESSSPTLTNCILWGDTKPEIFNFDSGSTANVTYSDIQDGGYLSDGNIDADPIFLDPENGDFHLWACSPCIDAGTDEASDLPEFDFEGDTRIIDGDGDGTPTVDMGVDEFAEGGSCSRIYLPLVLRGY